MNLLAIAGLWYLGDKVYRRSLKKAFTLEVLLPFDWEEVSEGMFHSPKTGKAIVILEKSVDEIFAESSKYPAQKSNLPGKLVNYEGNYFYFLINQKSEKGYIIGFSEMSGIEINAFCGLIKTK